MAMRMPAFVLGVALFFGLGLEAGAATLEAQIDRTAIVEGETVRLRLRSPLSGAGSAPDLKDLERDFEILSTQRSQRISIVQGRQEATLDWIVTLLPRRVGRLEIPSLHSGGAVSRPLSLEVTGATAVSGSDRPDLFVEGSVDRMSPHVQSTFRYTVKVYDGVGLRSGSLGSPEVPDAYVRSAGEGREYDEVVEGRPYRVHEREYLITPHASGPLRIPPVVLEGRVEDPRARRPSPFDDFFGGGDPFGGAFSGAGFGRSLFDRMMRPGRAIRVRSNEISLDVQPRPDGASGGWFLPASEVELRDSLAGASPVFRVGEATERKVVLRARGSSADQLPEIRVPAPDGARQYEEGVRDGDVAGVGDAVAVREQTVSIVPTREGTLILPAIEVPWWDIEANRERIARLPERTIEVLPAADPARSAPNVGELPLVSSTDGGEPEAPEDTPPRAERVEVPAQREWPPVPATLVAALGLGSAFYFGLRRRRSRKDHAPSPTPRSETERIRRACRSGDAVATRDAFVAWSHARFGTGAPANPRGIAHRLGHGGLAREATLLDRVIYAPGDNRFDGEAFWREFRGALRAVPVSSTQPLALLPELYPGA